MQLMYRNKHKAMAMDSMEQAKENRAVKQEAARLLAEAAVKRALCDKSEASAPQHISISSDKGMYRIYLGRRVVGFARTYKTAKAKAWALGAAFSYGLLPGFTEGTEV